MFPFTLAAGSVPGRDHREAGRNNQDAAAWLMADDHLVAVVCDGCSAGSHSEVGAKLVARLIASTASQRYRERQPTADALQAWWETIRQDVLAQLRVLSLQMSGSLTQVAHDYFLCTAIVGFITPTFASVHAIGDGIVAINGDVRQLGPFPGNEPPYLGYSLLNPALFGLNPDDLQFRTVALLPTADLQSLLVGTDGVVDVIRCAGHVLPGRTETLGCLNQFWEDCSYLTNPDKIRRRLAIASRDAVHHAPNGACEHHHGLLPDDTTCIVVRRQAAKEEQ